MQHQPCDFDINDYSRQYLPVKSRNMDPFCDEYEYEYYLLKQTMNNIRESKQFYFHPSLLHNFSEILSA